ncbi:lipid carrier--UDP-N-acetylgalactosaminyltransferase [Planococcus maritimus]|uniref:sugar transferase n=1 Tax=Planococcus maritimus TaxID=192421 RepID=UPI00080EF996|nr:sugar transferase [Planococcus maritimus]ANU17915.1 lipid carrier--UDP-N-acetylgalactosaminyltransferase [Planococcus maritimus]
MFSLIKRFVDFTLSLLILASLSIIFLILCLIIKLDSKGPVFFKQKRIGKGKQEFHILKFRTMKTDAPKEMPTHLLDKPDAYITPVGSFLRKTSLDELPQLINILKGEMSLIGPRPALWNQYDLIAERDKYKANDVLPGLTGLAQISGRDELPIELKAKIDGEYVEKQNPKLDSEIFVKTVFSVLRSDGVKEGTGLSNKNL